MIIGTIAGVPEKAEDRGAVRAAGRGAKFPACARPS